MINRSKGITTVTVLLLLLSACTLASPAFGASPKPVLSVTDYKASPYTTVSTTSSGPLMPGDSGTVVVTITNTIKTATAGNTTVHSDSVTSNYFQGSYQTPGMIQTSSDQRTSSDGSLSSATIRFVNLVSDGPIHVESAPSSDIGVLGPGDSMKLEFGIKADSAASDGTYLLTLTVKTTDDEVYVNYPIRVQVDHTEPMLVLSKYPEAFNTSEDKLSLDVANPRKSSIEAVSIEASGDEFVFEPQEFFVGTLKAGDTYTADFRVDSREKTYGTSPRFTMVYRNGDNWHRTASVAVTTHVYPQEKSYWENVWDNWWPYIIAGVLCLITLIFFVRVVVPALHRRKGH